MATKPTVASLSEELQVMRANYGETINELELALEDVGWNKLSGADEHDFSRDGLRKICKNSFLFFEKNPLIGRSVETKANYVFGQGVTIKAEHPLVDEVVQTFMDDRKNKKVFSTVIQLVKLEKDLNIDGNLFFAFFKNSDGQVRISPIIFDEIWDTVTNPEDKNEVWLYERQWNDKRDSSGHFVSTGKVRKEYYPDWEHRPSNANPTYNGKPVHWESPVYHVKVNAVLNQKFGLSEIYSAQDWARAYNRFLQDWATIVRSYARFAWQMTKKSGSGGRLAAKTKLDSQISSDNYKPAPAAGSVFIGSDDTKMAPMRTAGATTSAEDGRRLLLMVCAATGLPECYSEDTEVLTDHGFILHDQWREGIRVACYDPDTGSTSFEHPTGLAVHNHVGEMIHFKNQQTDILVTPNHRMWTAPEVQWEPVPSKGVPDSKRINDGAEPKVNREWRIEEADYLLSNPRSAGWRVRYDVRFDEKRYEEKIETPIGEVDAVAWAKFIGYFVSEGSTTVSTCKSGEFRKDGTPIMRDFRRILLSQRDGETLENMKLALNTLGLHYGETTVNAGVKNLTIWNKPLWMWLREVCGGGSHTKQVPGYMFDASKNVRRALYEALMAGDGGRSGGSWRYSTASTILADQMQMLAISLGYGASITLEIGTSFGRESHIYRVLIRTKMTKESHLMKQHVSKVWYEGTIYCFQVPTGIYVTRRNGKIAIQGNTFYGDASVGTLATARSLNRPTELAFSLRQLLWESIWEDILEFVIQTKADVGYTSDDPAIKGSLTGDWGDDSWEEQHFIYADDTENEDLDMKGKPIDTSVSVDFPSLVEDNQKEQVEAIVTAATLNGSPLAGTIDAEYTTEALLRVLGETSIDDVMKKLFPEGEEPEAKAVAGAVQDLQQAIEALSESREMERGEVVSTLAAAFIEAMKESKEAGNER